MARAIIYPHRLRRWHAGHDAKHPDLDCGLCREAGWFVTREQVDELVRAARDWANLGPEDVTHALVGQHGCPHCEAEAYLRAVVQSFPDPGQ